MEPIFTTEPNFERNRTIIDIIEVPKIESLDENPQIKTVDYPFNGCTVVDQVFQKVGVDAALHYIGIYKGRLPYTGSKLQTEPEFFLSATFYPVKPDTKHVPHEVYFVKRITQYPEKKYFEQELKRAGLIGKLDTVKFF